MLMLYAARVILLLLQHRFVDCKDKIYLLGCRQNMRFYFKYRPRVYCRLGEVVARDRSNAEEQSTSHLECNTIREKCDGGG